MFIQVIQGKTSRPDELKAFGETVRSERDEPPVGWLGSTFGITDNNDFFGVVRFESREAAMANSARPETGEFAAKLGALMDGELTFFDSDQVESFLDGGSDDAGFVQIIRGKADPGLWQKMGDMSQLREMRPEIIGGTVAIKDDGTFVETVAFRDEGSARKGESDMTAAPPPEIAEALEAIMDGAEFYDVREPMFSSP
jgi:hypothetical protein